MAAVAVAFELVKIRAVVFIDVTNTGETILFEVADTEYMFVNARPVFVEKVTVAAPPTSAVVPHCNNKPFGILEYPAVKLDIPMFAVPIFKLTEGTCTPIVFTAKALPTFIEAMPTTVLVELFANLIVVTLINAFAIVLPTEIALEFI